MFNYNQSRCVCFCLDPCCYAPSSFPDQAWIATQDGDVAIKSVLAQMVRLKVCEIAEAQKINMSKLSRMADMTYNTIRAIWDNEMKDVTVSTLEKIA
jgi:DNA-binding Xre family transcriptional regulator